MRQDIIKSFDQPIMNEFDYYTQLKSCIICEDVDRIDNWFKGIIESLYYRPNHYSLILCGEDGVGCNKFLRNLIPGPWFAEEYIEKESMYFNLVIKYEFEKKSLDIVESDNFLIREGYPGNPTVYPVADKRLASYCSVVPRWIYPPRKNFIVLNVKWIEMTEFLSIPKQLLWSQIFNHFKPLGK